MKSFIEFAKTRSQNVNHSFRILKMFYRSFFYVLVGLFVFVRPVVAFIRLLTNECLLLTHITSAPWLAVIPLRGVCGHGWIFINSYNPLHFVYSI